MSLDTRDYNLDNLKAYSIIFVLIWHLEPFNITSSQPKLNLIYTFLIDFIMWQVSLVAVPTFIVVSLYLFFSKAVDRNFYLIKRLKNLGIVFFSG
jgi:surface polysaccharide O-acyltransferase-like enzyme